MSQFSHLINNQPMIKDCVEFHVTCLTSHNVAQRMELELEDNNSEVQQPKIDYNLQMIGKGAIDHHI